MIKNSNYPNYNSKNIMIDNKVNKGSKTIDI